MNFRAQLVAVAVGSIALIGAGCGTASTTNTTSQSSTNTTGRVAGYALTDVAKHASASDCWVVVSGSVYDVTDFIPRHPGGSDKIVPLCGMDATTAFTTREGMGPHPSRATTTLNEYFVGGLLGD